MAPNMVARMSPEQAKRYAVLAPAAAVMLAFVVSATNEKDDIIPPARVVFGGVSAAVILTLLAEVNAPVAGGLALLLLITAMFVIGGDAWEGIARIVGNDGKPRGSVAGGIPGLAAAKRAAEADGARPPARNYSQPTPPPYDGGGSAGGGGGGGSF